MFAIYPGCLSQKQVSERISVDGMTEEQITALKLLIDAIKNDK